MPATIIDDVARERIGQLWTAAQQAESEYIAAERQLDMARNADYHLGGHEIERHQSPSDDLFEPSNQAGDYANDASDKWQQTRRELRQALVEVLGEPAGPLADALYTARDARYRPGMMSFHERVGGERGKARDRAADAAKDAINALAGGEPILA